MEEMDEMAANGEQVDDQMGGVDMIMMYMIHPFCMQPCSVLT